MPRRNARTRTDTAISSLQCATTAELMHELRRRALGCMLIAVKAEEHGDAWNCVVKGSPILLGAMSAALSLKTKQLLAGHNGEEQMTA